MTQQHVAGEKKTVNTDREDCVDEFLMGTQVILEISLIPTLNHTCACTVLILIL